MSLTYGELCAGFGGLGAGAQAVLGGELAWYSEFDPAPCKVMTYHHPGVPNLGDMTKVNWRAAPRVHVLTGGTPCQDLSPAGKRAGMTEGTRSNLWVQMREAVAAIRPSLVIWENVQGALSAKAASALMPDHFDDQIRWHLRVAAETRSTDVRRRHNRAANRLMELRSRRVGDGKPGPVLRALGRVLGDLADLGYDTAWYGLRASDVGAAHGRFRVFVFAWPADAPGDTWRLIHGDGGAAADGQGGEQREPVLGVGERAQPGGSDRPAADAVGGRLDGRAPESVGESQQRADAAGGGEGHRGPLVGATELTLLPTPAVNDMGAGKTVEHWDAWTERMQAAHGNGNGHGKSLSIEALRLLPTPVADNSRGLPSSGTDYASLPNAVSLLPTPRATDGTKGGPNQAGSSGDLMLPSAVQSDRWGEYAPAIARWEIVTGRPAPDPTEPSRTGTPALSGRFTEWLMGLRDGHLTHPDIGLTRNNVLKIGGNGVVPQQAAAATRAWLADFAAIAQTREATS